MKRLFIIFCVAAMLTVPALAAEPESVSAKATVLMERETGTVIYAQNPDKKLPPASVTKVMTMLLTAEALDSGAISKDDLVTVSAEAASMGGSQVYLEEGEQMTVDDLLKSVAVASGNDAAVALAEHIAGSQSAFVDRMNQRAKELGMEHTHFSNCNGLPAKDHLTTAYDIALMSRALLQHDVIRDYVSIWMDSIRDGSFQLANTNKLIRAYPGATGLKTGSTNDAGFCISASAQRDGMELIAVVLGSKTSAERFNSAKSMLDFGFSQYTLVDASPKELPQVPVTLGKSQTVQAELKGNCLVLVRKDQVDQVQAQISTEETVAAPVKKGDSLGSVTVTVDGETVKTVPLVASTDVERLTFSGIFQRMWQTMTMQDLHAS